MNFDDFNKIAGAVIGSLLVFLLLGFFGGQIFGTRVKVSEHEPLAFALETGGDDAGIEEEAVDYAALVAAADPAKGEKTFAKCKACHAVTDGSNGTGPHLWGVVNREIGSVSGFGYSDALASKGGVWDLAALDGFLANPKGWAPGTKMSFGGIKKVEDRVNLIVYLNEADGTPEELAVAGEESSEEAATEEAATEETATEEAATEEAATEEAATEEAATEEAASTDPGADTGVALLADADSDRGKAVFRQCRACHSVDQGKNTVGPSLYGVVGRDIASGDGFRYSDALLGKDGVWTPANLDAWLESPRDWAPGTKMNFPGLKSASDRADVIAFIDESDGSPNYFGVAPGSVATEETVAASTTEPSDQGASEAETTSGTEAASTEGDAPAPSGGGDMAALLAAADADAGKKVYRKCSACHKLTDGAKGVGPHLWGVVGRDIAAVDGYKYSDALSGKDGTWDLEALDAFLKDPKGWVPGTKMGFNGIKDPQDRINVITYINEADGSPEPLQ